MYCKNCGAEIADGSTFCTQCGAPVQQEQPQAQPQPQPQPVYTAEPAVQAPEGKPILILGILSIALNSIPYVGWIGGLICAIICANKVKAYLAAGGQLTGVAKVGKILGTVGLIISIVCAVIYAIAIVVAIIGAIAGSINYSSYLS
jgi:hypothetical protein